MDITESRLRRIINVQIEPTSDCNLRCGYCYKGTEKTPSYMSIKLLEDIVVQVLKYATANSLSVEFIFHGGEPTMMGAEFFSAAFELIESKKQNINVSYSIQTNGTLLSESLLNLFAKQPLYLGVSLDSPEPKYHDLVRPTIDGSSKHSRILDGIRLARALNIDVGVLMSLTEENAHLVKDMFKLCRQEDVRLGIGAIGADLYERHSKMSISPHTFLNACIDSFDLWFFQKERHIRVNPAFGLVQTLLSKYSDDEINYNCQNYYVSIGPEGDIYPCNRFYGFAEFKFGNIRNGFNEAMKSEPRQRLLARLTSVHEKCMKCEIKQYCRGGCMHHAIANNGSLEGSDHLCYVYRHLFKHAFLRLSEVISKKHPKTLHT